MKKRLSEERIIGFQGEINAQEDPGPGGPTPLLG